MLSSTFVNAIDVDVDLGVGYTWFGAPANGNWYQEEFSNDLDMDSPNFYIGLRWGLTDNLDLLTGYKYLGRFSTSALASASDHNYFAWKRGEAEIWDLSHWEGTGETDGIVVALEYSWNRFLVKGGLWAHRTDWSVHVPDWYCPMVDGICVPDHHSQEQSDFTRDITAVHDGDTWMYSSMFGIGYQVTDDVSIMWETYKNKKHNRFSPANTGKTQSSITINYTWR
jgi:hypothetical protein